ncbi:MAG: hypothetical protein JXR94_06710 [Candidatus Hydrogenedentes bacterium]|nr:hypothetical protein [Candidatus Hydrogenedentota bacterium]
MKKLNAMPYVVLAGGVVVLLAWQWEIAGEPECIYSDEAPPTASCSGDPNNEQVKINDLDMGTITPCAGSYVLLRASGGYDWDIQSATGCESCDSGVYCGEGVNNATTNYVWEKVSGNSDFYGAAFGNLNRAQYVKVHKEWGDTSVFKASRAECGVADDDDSRTWTHITVVAREPGRIGRSVCAHEDVGYTTAAAEAKMEAATQDIFWFDEDARLLTDDNHCCKGFQASGNLTEFDDNDVDANDTVEDGTYKTIDEDTYKVMVETPNPWAGATWNDEAKYKTIVIVDSIEWTRTLGTISPAGSRPGFYLPARHKLYYEDGANEHVWAHEYGHFCGLKDLYNVTDDDPVVGKAAGEPWDGCENNFMAVITKGGVSTVDEDPADPNNPLTNQCSKIP